MANDSDAALAGCVVLILTLFTGMLLGTGAGVLIGRFIWGG